MPKPQNRAARLDFVTVPGIELLMRTQRIARRQCSLNFSCRQAPKNRAQVYEESMCCVRSDTPSPSCKLKRRQTSLDPFRAIVTPNSAVGKASPLGINVARDLPLPPGIA
jgi:hypothetical protein